MAEYTGTIRAIKRGTIVVDLDRAPADFTRLHLTDRHIAFGVSRFPGTKLRVRLDANGRPFATAA